MSPERIEELRASLVYGVELCQRPNGGRNPVPLWCEFELTRSTTRSLTELSGCDVAALERPQAAATLFAGRTQPALQRCARRVEHPPMARRGRPSRCPGTDSSAKTRKPRLQRQLPLLKPDFLSGVGGIARTLARRNYTNKRIERLPCPRGSARIRRLRFVDSFGRTLEMPESALSTLRVDEARSPLPPRPTSCRSTPSNARHASC